MLLVLVGAETMVWMRPAIRSTLLPEGRAAHTCTQADGKLFVFGGNDRSELHKSVWVLDTGARPAWFLLPASTPLHGRVEWS